MGEGEETARNHLIWSEFDKHDSLDSVLYDVFNAKCATEVVGEMLALDYWQAEAFLKERGVPLNYSAADLEADNATLAKILAHP